MKKNKIMRLASALLVLTLMTTCAISSTFAKYTTSTTGTDKARVAYWGFDQTANTTLNLFSETYDNVKGGEKVVAPGTSQEETFGFKYVGNTAKTITAPEVGYKFTVNAVATGSYAKLDANKNFKWTLKSGAADAEEKEFDTVADLLNAIKALSGDASGSKDYKPGELPPAFGTADANAECTIGWKWEFDANNNDVNDTAMGNAADLDNVKIDITVTATQND